MADRVETIEQKDESASGSAEPALFRTRKAEKTPVPLTAWVIAALAVLLLVGGIALFTRESKGPVANASTILPEAAGAATLQVSQVAMSESTSLSGGKSTYIDGHISNHGGATVTAVDAQVLFANDAGSAPQVEHTPLTLIRTRQPYVDVEPVSAEPIKPGEDREFRLIFEGINPGWNQQLPAIHLVRVTTR